VFQPEYKNKNRMTKDNLFELIQSLSKTEKRYFSVNGGSDDSNHIRLFKLMSSMKEFDEEKLKKKFPKNLSWEKGNLYKLILKNMRNYRSDKSAYAEIKEAILDAQFLLKRGFYEQSLKRIQKGKEIAEKLLRHGDLYELNELERKILILIKPQTLQEDIHKLINKQQQIVQKIQEEADAYNAYHLSALAFLKQLSLPSKELKEQFLNKLAEKKDDEISPTSPRAQYHYLLIKKFNAQLLQKYEVVNKYAKKITDWWEENSVIKEEEKYQYIGDVFNYLASCLALKQFDEVLLILIKMEEEKPKNALAEKVLFRLLVQFKHLYYINIGDFTKAKKEYFKVVKTLNTIGLNEKNRTTIFINFAILFFFTEDFEDCITAVDEMLKKRQVKNRQSLQWVGRTLKCICYLELWDVDNFDSYFRSTKRIFRSAGLTASSFELTLLQLLKKVSESSFTEQKEIYPQILSLVNTQKNNPNGVESLGLDEYHFWIRSKVEKIPMVKLFQETL
jgi:hypothetical protein